MCQPKPSEGLLGFVSLPWLTFELMIMWLSFTGFFSSVEAADWWWVVIHATIGCWSTITAKRLVGDALLAKALYELEQKNDQAE